jgi:hypothetical protein
MEVGTTVPTSSYFMRPYLFLLLGLLQACASKQDQAPRASGLPGETLAKMHCSSCHSYVGPEMLDRSTWENKTLPEMGLRLGIGDVFSKNVLQVQQGTESLVTERIYPLSPRIHEEDYAKIVQFYLENAPARPLPQSQRPPVDTLMAAWKFEPLLVSDGFQHNTTAISYDRENAAVWAGSPRGEVKVFRNGLPEKVVHEPGVFSVIRQHKGETYLLDLGFLGPHEKKMGRLITASGKVLLEQLHKPADIGFMDVNEDGTDDFLVCNFGFETGSFAWYDGKSKAQHVIKEIPGARNLVVQDMDGDGRKDVVVLFAQALEGISVFYNKGKGKFKEEEVLKFSPVYGSSWFELADFNGDGRWDILYANGDNADYSGTLKNYHGVRIFENRGGKYKQVYFYPMYGATQARAGDFDGDGDIDIAAIAYYRKDAGEGFVYLENKGAYTFQPARFPEVSWGQWMVLEVGDYNGDGKVDILLGAHDLARKPQKVKTPTEVGVLYRK